MTLLQQFHKQCLAFARNTLRMACCFCAHQDSFITDVHQFLKQCLALCATHQVWLVLLLLIRIVISQNCIEFSNALSFVQHIMLQLLTEMVCYGDMLVMTAVPQHGISLRFSLVAPLVQILPVTLAIQYLLRRCAISCATYQAAAAGRSSFCRGTASSG